MSREEVAEKTKIPTSILSALEGGQAQRLPAKVFVVNYVRAYAQVIGLEPDEVVLRYEEIYTGSHTALSPVELERRRKGKAYRILGMIVLVLALAGGAIAWWQMRGGAAG